MNTGISTVNNSTTDWWKNGVAYQIYVRSFADANGDGIGDLEGIISKLDYLVDLGVDAFWLNPCYPSPQADHGYDVADYLNIEPAYGDLDVFDRLVHESHARGLKVLMDIVPNHCSDQHVWFQQALAAGPTSAEREWFWFRDGKGVDGSEPPNNWSAWFGGSAWTRVTEPDGRLGQWYLHLFTPDQPDLNWTHPPVADAFDDILRFWWDRGVDGFRIDAPNVVGKTPGLPDAPPVAPGTPDTDVAVQNPHIYHRPEVHDLFRRWRQTADQYLTAHPGRDLVYFGETFAPSIDLVASYVGDNELHTTFNFALLLNNWQPHRWADALIEAARHPDVLFTWALNNHDAQRSASRYGHTDAALPSSFTANNLINSEAPIDLAIGVRRAEAAMWLLAFLPGPIFLYAGEELGLHEVLDLPDDALQDPIFFRTEGRQRGRDGCRVPLPWTDDRSTNFGFSGGHLNPPAPWMPQPDEYGMIAATIQQQTDQQHSTLRSYQQAIRARRLLASLEANAPLTISLDGVVLRISRGVFTCVTNFGDEPVVLADVRLFAGSPDAAVQDFTLDGSGTVWVRTP
jgi:alpha-glucosidase